jgi:C-terminal processing protease CtpA/Prc
VPTAEQAKSNAGTITGKVIDAEKQSIPGVIVILCEQSSGVPVCQETFRPFTEAVLAEKGDPLKDIVYVVTNGQGCFSFEKVPVGEYRLVAQSWKDAEEFKGLFEINRKEIQLHGIAEHIRVCSEISPDVVLRPLGTGVLQVDEDMPNDETLLVISTSPTRADPILGFAGWGGPFIRNMIGGNRMPEGKTNIYGLPEGKVYLAMFAADSVPGWTEGTVEIRPNTTTVLDYIQFVNSWSNSRHDPPEHLVPVFKEVQQLISQKDKFIFNLYQNSGIQIDPSKGMWGFMEQIGSHLAKEVELPSGRKATFGEVMAAAQYVQLQQIVERRKERNKRRAEIADMKTSIPDAQKSGSYEEAFFDLYRELGERYPCFELKKINWKAVGEEFLPRAKKAKSDEEFGLLCMEFVARLEDSHAHLLEGSAKLPQISFPQWDPGFACLTDDQERPVVYYVDKGGPAEKAGIKVGMVVNSINAEDAKKVIKETMRRWTKYIGYSSEHYMRYHAHRFFIRQKERGAIVKFKMLDGKGEAHNFELPATLGVRYLPRLPVPKAGISDAGSISWKMLDGQIGYIYVRRIRGDLIELLDKAVGELKDARGLIVDVRGNSGGGFDSRRAHSNFALDKDSEEPERPRYKGPIALLIDSRCISAGEGWASWFVANNRARLFGETTAGASSRKTIYELKNGLYKVRFPVKAYKGYLGRPIERLGLKPDVPIFQNAQDLIERRDTVLQAAKQYLLEHVK